MSERVNELVGRVRKALVYDGRGRLECAICGADLPGHRTDCEYAECLPALEELHRIALASIQETEPDA